MLMVHPGFPGLLDVHRIWDSSVCRSDSNPTKCQEPAWYFWDYSVGEGVLLSQHTITEVFRKIFVSAEQQLGSHWCLCHPTKEEGEADGHNQAWAVPDMRTIPCAHGLVPRRNAAGNESWEIITASDVLGVKC